MTDEIRVSSQGNGNGELKLDLKERKIGLTSKELPLIILMALMGVGFYLAFQSLTHRLDRGAYNQDEGFRKLEKVLELGHDTQKVIIAEIQRRADKLEAGQQAQNVLLGQQTTILETKFTNQQEYLEAWFSEIGQRMEWLDHNIANPERHMPLRAPPASREEYKPERGR